MCEGVKIVHSKYSSKDDMINSHGLGPLPTCSRENVGFVKPTGAVVGNSNALQDSDTVADLVALHGAEVVDELADLHDVVVEESSSEEEEVEVEGGEREEEGEPVTSENGRDCLPGQRWESGGARTLGVRGGHERCRCLSGDICQGARQSYLRGVLVRFPPLEYVCSGGVC